MSKRWFFCGLAATAVVASCSDDERPSAGPDGGGSEPRAGSTNNGAGSPQGNAGESAGGLGGAGAGGDFGLAGAAGEGGTAEPGSGGLGFGGEPTPPVGDPPRCSHAATYEAGVALAISGPGDDVLQSITPFELTIAWKSGADFYVADRALVEDPFGAPLLVAGSADYDAVSLGADGLRLIAVRKDRRVVQLVREAGQAFSEASPGAGDFAAFNTAILGDPTPGRVLADAVLSADEESFFFSYFSGEATGPTLRESRRSGDMWSLSSFHLGTLLDAAADQRRIPTGVSSDALTLFYRDEVEADFRVAWRVNRDQPFTSAKSLSLGTGTYAAAPNRSCSRLYYSAEGAAGLDLFVSIQTAPPVQARRR